MLYRLGEDKGDGLINLDHVVAMRYYEIEGLGEKGFGIWMTGRDPKGQVPSYYVTKEQYDEIICILR